MVRQAEDDGIDVVCATPHIRHDHNVGIEEIASRVRSLGAELADRGLGVHVVPGGELAETDADRLTDAELHLVALGGDGGWVLLEPAPGPLRRDLRMVVERLAGRGMKTVIAHPERHADAEFEERLCELRDCGCLLQWTAEFVSHASSDDLVLRFAREGLVHLLGSDAHSSYAGRPVRLAAGFARLGEVCTPARITWMADEAPEAILRGAAVTPLP